MAAVAAAPPAGDAVATVVMATASSSPAAAKSRPTTAGGGAPVANGSGDAAALAGSRAYAPVVDSILDTIGNTPMLRVSQIDTGCCELFLKLENQNPGGSIKDRIALSMIEAAERDGRIAPGAHLFEATAGNTGTALALVAGRRGYKLTVVVPDKMAKEKVVHLRAMGAEVLTTRSDVEKGHPEYYQDIAERLARESGAFFVNQFFNPANPEGHIKHTGPEIWAQMGGRLDAFVCGVGSGGTMGGVGGYLRERNPGVELVLADPVGSILAPLTRGERVQPGSWMVEGIGEDFIPPVMGDIKAISSAYSVSDADAFEAARELLQREGVLAGSSSGVLLAAALRYCREQTTPKRVVTLVCDSGAKYLTKYFDRVWRLDNGFESRGPPTGDVRDLIARRHQDREDVTAAPNLPVEQAIRRMRANGISQMAVLDNNGGGGGGDGGKEDKEAGEEAVVGIVDESDLLLALVRDRAAAPARPVSDYMERRVETVAPTARVSELMPLFRADRVAVVAGPGGKPFFGLVTKIDLINHLRARVGELGDDQL